MCLEAGSGSVFPCPPWCVHHFQRPRGVCLCGLVMYGHQNLIELLAGRPSFIEPGYSTKSNAITWKSDNRGVTRWCKGLWLHLIAVIFIWVTLQNTEIFSLDWSVLNIRLVWRRVRPPLHSGREDKYPYMLFVISRWSLVRFPRGVSNKYDWKFVTPQFFHITVNFSLSYFFVTS